MDFPSNLTPVPRHKEMTFNAHRVCMQEFIIEHLILVTTVYDSQISQKLEIEYEAHREKH